MAVATTLRDSFVRVSGLPSRFILTCISRETVSLEYPDKYFNFLDQLSNPERFPLTSRTVEEEHRAALVLAVEGGIIQDPEALARIQMNLVLSSATPKLEAFYNYYEANYENQPTPDCESWVDWYGKLVCDVATLAQVVGEEPTDHPLRPYVMVMFIRRVRISSFSTVD